jgi:hypothetical protein
MLLYVYVIEEQKCVSVWLRGKIRQVIVCLLKTVLCHFVLNASKVKRAQCCLSKPELPVCRVFDDVSNCVKHLHANEVVLSRTVLCTFHCNSNFAVVKITRKIYISQAGGIVTVNSITEKHFF